MIRVQQVRLFMKFIRKGYTLQASAVKAGMDRKTAAKYLRSGKLPNDMKTIHDWQTRKDPFEKYWPDIEAMLNANPGLEAKTIFQWLNDKEENSFLPGQLRTRRAAFQGVACFIWT